MKLLKDNILVEKIEENPDTELIVIQNSKDKFETYLGKVEEVGPGRKAPNGNRLKMDVSKGDKILYRQFAGHKIDEKHWIIGEKDVLGIIEK